MRTTQQQESVRIHSECKETVKSEGQKAETGMEGDTKKRHEREASEHTTEASFP